MLAAELLLAQPLPIKKLCKAFQAQTGTSLVKACSPSRPADVLASYPNRFRVADGVVHRVRSELCESDYLAAAAAILPKNADLAEAFAKCLQENLCFDCKVHVGGSVGRGTATTSMRDADLVVAFAGVSRKAAHEWAPPILGALEAMLGMIPFEYKGKPAPVLVLGNKGTSYLTVQVAGQQMRVWVTPEVHRQHLKSIDWTSTNAPYLAPGLDRPFTLWVRSQSATVKHAIRLVKEWAASQSWSSAYQTPAPALLELIVIHCATEHPEDATSLDALVQRVHSVLRVAESLSITWNKSYAWYEPAAVAAPTVQDPFHPARNHADPAAFDASELARFAAAASNLLVHTSAARALQEDAESYSSFLSASSSAYSTPSTTAPSENSNVSRSLSDVSSASSPLR